MPQGLLNKVAVVTGADGGIGRAIAEQFAAEGARVVAAGRRGELLDEVCQRAPARMLAATVDVGRPPDLEQLVTAAVRRFGPVDVLVPAAGTVRLVPFRESTPETVQEQFAMNFLAAQQMVRLFLPHLNRSGSVIFLTGEPATDRGDGLSIYSATQGAVRALARSLAELVPRGIRVNCLAFGTAQIEPNDGLESTRHPASLNEVAETAVFLASDASCGVTGQELVINVPKRPE